MTPTRSPGAASSSRVVHGSDLGGAVDGVLVSEVGWKNGAQASNQGGVVREDMGGAVDGELGD